MREFQACLFCSGDASDPNHADRCDGRQGRVEAAIPDDPIAVVLDLPEGRRRRDVAIAQVQAARDAFMAAAALAIETLARRVATFITDDVWVELQGATWPRERRAMGAAMRAAQRRGLIQPTDQFAPSARPECHANPKRIWRSLLCNS